MLFRNATSISLANFQAESRRPHPTPTAEESRFFIPPLAASQIFTIPWPPIRQLSFVNDQARVDFPRAIAGKICQKKKHFFRFQGRVFSEPKVQIKAAVVRFPGIAI